MHFFLLPYSEGGIFRLFFGLKPNPIWVKNSKNSELIDDQKKMNGRLKTSIEIGQQKEDRRWGGGGGREEEEEGGMRRFE